MDEITIPQNQTATASTSAMQPIVHAPKRRKWKYFFGGLLILFVGVVAWVGISGALALKNITAKNSGDQSSFFRFEGAVPPDQLKGEGDGRINVLLAGIGGAGHPGGQLADTIQIFSLDPINKTYSLLSLPRDLYVTIPKNGKSKINAVYANGALYCKGLNACDPKVDQGGAALKATVASVLDTPIHYFIRIDFRGFEKIVDTLGGIQIYVERPLNDPLFPDEQLRGFDPLFIPAGLQTMNGRRALKYARSRQSTSDFDRARRQQQVLVALRKKLLAAGTLANPKKITDLINILGAHLKTDLQPGELSTLFTLIKEVDESKTITKVLDTSNGSPLRSSNDPQAGYIIFPKKGPNDFGEVQEFVRTVFQEPYIIKEAARLVIENGSNSVPLGESLERKLRSLGYNITEVKTVSAQSASVINYYNNDKPYTLALLKKRLKLAATKAKAPESLSADLVIRIGNNFILN